MKTTWTSPIMESPFWADRLRHREAFSRKKFGHRLPAGSKIPSSPPANSACPPSSMTLWANRERELTMSMQDYSQTETAGQVDPHIDSLVIAGILRWHLITQIRRCSVGLYCPTGRTAPGRRFRMTRLPHGSLRRRTKLATVGRPLRVVPLEL